MTDTDHAYDEAVRPAAPEMAAAARNCSRGWTRTKTPFSASTSLPAGTSKPPCIPAVRAMEGNQRGTR